MIEIKFDKDNNKSIAYDNKTAEKDSAEKKRRQHKEENDLNERECKK